LSPFRESWEGEKRMGNPDKTTFRRDRFQLYVGWLAQK
jgi:hypothetical protein